MRIAIVAVGKLKEPYFRAAADEYLKRLRPYADLREIEVPDRDLASGEERARRAEAEGVLRALPDGAHVVALDAGGAQRTSEEFASWLSALGLGGRSTLAFVVGGSAGLDASVLERADEVLSLGKMTLPHQLARVVLLEQVYRAFRIVRGEPYHR
ncbi:23S rRNA (pseudouridine(1915)-N(3))-methyltransferase RlmH [Coriobacteriia bacterium Es71-Z0120]|uniref:23S rRNA (pseudouridine(1915)-N(3))-methyltransferase RlmH n=1 Tax=Parvivirga hydrogeniphila TaxID=2939460 RepID=UPI002260A561|nr:23S rRNA (pseudouridine(1915)-N(3))-methyltransferase RlmH [Parvivirga hydrogeniphila]MCL4079284.1 23S rRNA (pseudouridine(1915)-N(3))-methyltransferase RlmH [Parvivirga hydrogeniphila]